jgi:hypothetical protein
VPNAAIASGAFTVISIEFDDVIEEAIEIPLANAVTSGTVTTLTGHTAQTGDTYALANGSAGFVAIDTVVDAVQVATDKLTFTTANQVDANMLSVSSDGPAADALEAQYDGTGLTGDEYPAKQSVVNAILVDTAAIATLNNISAADILGTALTESYASDGATMTVAEALYMLIALNGEKEVSGTVLTVYKLDGSTSAGTFTLNSASAPTKINRAS